MQIRHWVLGTIVSIGLWMGGIAWPVHAHPEPAIVSPAWQLEFEFSDPRPISIEDVDGRTQWYWYMPYKVVNNTGQERLFIPEVQIAFDNGTIVDADQNVPARVFTAARQRLRNDLLVRPENVVGKLLQGEDYARESVAIWPHPSGEVDEMTVFFAGLSGETATIDHPTEENETIILRRTRMLQYNLPGRVTHPQRQPVRKLEERDVMR